MITEFKKSLFQYLTVFIFLTVALVGIILPTSSPLGFLSPISKFLLITLSLFVAHTLAAVISTKTGNKEFDRIANTLMVECNLDEFFKEATPLFKKGSKQSNLVKSILLGNAYLAKGDYQEVLNILDKSLQDSNVDWITEEMKLNLCHIYRNACIALVETEKYKEAINQYDKLSDLAFTINKSAVYKEESESVKLFTRDYIGVFTKPSMNVNDLEERFTKETSKYTKLLISHLLIRHFLKHKNNPKKSIYSTFIADNPTDCFKNL